MNMDVYWRPAPEPVDNSGGVGWPMKEWLADALEEDSLDPKGVYEIRRGDNAYHYLRGIRRGLVGGTGRVGGEAWDELDAFIRFVDKHGAAEVFLQ